MARSSRTVVLKKRGRPATGNDPVTAIRLSKEMRSALDVWRRKQEDLPSRSEAIRRLVDKGLNSEKTASQLAGKMIDELADPTATVAEKRSRKHHLMKGPEEFREHRTDHPTRRK